MTRLRRAISRLAVTWLLCQVATLTVAPTVLWLGSAEELLECTCTHGDHAICPMHHKPAPGSKLCVMGSADDDTAIPATLFGSAGLLPMPASAVQPPSQRAAVVAEPTTRSLRPAPPDPPPPRL